MQASIKNVQEINTVVTEPGNNKKCLSNEIKGLKKKCVWPTLFIRLHVFSLKHFSVLQVLPALALQPTTNHNYVIKTKHLSSR